jgi:hypothetical protein
MRDLVSAAEDKREHVRGVALTAQQCETVIGDVHDVRL